MKAIQKRKQVKPAMEFATDINIILECLYEVYGQEAHHVLKGRDIQKTMVFPFLKMLVNQCDGISVREMHKKLCNCTRRQSRIISRQSPTIGNFSHCVGCK